MDGGEGELCGVGHSGAPVVEHGTNVGPESARKDTTSASLSPAPQDKLMGRRADHQALKQEVQQAGPTQEDLDELHSLV